MICRSAIAALAAVLPSLAFAQGAPVYNWSGFYIGGQGGYGWSDTTFAWELPTIAPPAFEQETTNPEGFLGGGVLGAQFQWQSLVLGAEISASGGELDGGDSVVNFVSSIDRRFESNVEWLVTATGRMGLATDRWHFFVEGGYASAEVDLRTYRVADGELQTTSSQREHGVVGGIGAERALGDRFFVGAEYNYVHLFGDDRTEVNEPTTILSHHRDVDVDLHTVMGRVGIRFGSPPPPP